MNRFVLILALSLAPLSAQAEEPQPKPPGFGDIAPLMEGLRGLMEGWAEEARPLMEQLAEKMSDLNAYEAPEVLPNGDIIIRRKPTPDPAPEGPGTDLPSANPDGSIDL